MNPDRIDKSSIPSEAKFCNISIISVPNLAGNTAALDTCMTKCPTFLQFLKSDRFMDRRTPPSFVGMKCPKPSPSGGNSPRSGESAIGLPNPSVCTCGEL
ncbi:hypothetical protein SCA6_012042 [Theobroma cacao]